MTRWKLLLAIFVALFGAAFLYKISLAEEGKTWLNTEPIITIGADATDPALRPGNRDCINKTFTTQILAKSSDKAPTEFPTSDCMLTNPLGSFGKNYITPGGAGYGYKTLENASRYIELVGVPSQPKFIAVTRGSLAPSPGNFFYLSNSVKTSGTFKLLNSNTYRGYIYSYEDFSNPLTDSTGNMLNINNYTFSKNGEWLFAEVRNTGFMKMSMETGAMSLVTNRTYNYNIGLTTPLGIAISNDGRYSMISEGRNGSVTIFDSYNCQNPVSSLVVNNKPDPMCQQKDISPYLRSQINDYYWLSSIRFTPEGQSLKGVITQNPGGVPKNTRVTLSLSELDNKTSYIAMGDSYASGEGDMDDSYYEDGTDEAGVNLCHLSQRSYPYLLQNLLGHDEFHSVACSGAKQEHILTVKQHRNSTTNTPLGFWTPGTKEQISFVNEVDPPTYLTISIGGNDLGFGDILAACVIENTCYYSNTTLGKSDTAKRIARIYKDLVGTYKQVIEQTQRETKVYIVGYPQFINPNGETCGRNVQLDQENRKYITKSVSYANEVIAGAARKAGAYYLDVEGALNGRNLCSYIDDARMAVNGLTKGNDKPGLVNVVLHKLGSDNSVGVLGNESYHPNQNGHQILKDRILELTSGNPAEFQTCVDPSDKVCEDPSQAIPLPDTSYFGEDALNYARFLNDPANQSIPLSLEPSEVSNRMIVKSVTDRIVSLGINVAELANGTFRIILHSNPVELGTFTVNGEDEMDVSVEIPEGIEPGLHELHLVGKNIAGEPIDQFMPIYISNGQTGPCGYVEASGIDVDQDGIDDACDGFIGNAPIQIIPIPNFGSSSPSSGSTGSSSSSGATLISAITAGQLTPGINLPFNIQQAFDQINDLSVSSTQPDSVLGNIAAVDSSTSKKPNDSTAKNSITIFSAVVLIISILGIGFLFKKSLFN